MPANSKRQSQCILGISHIMWLVQKKKKKKTLCNYWFPNMLDYRERE